MYSFRQKISGATVSVISTGVLRTPRRERGRAEPVPCPARAPVPPVWNGLTTNASESPYGCVPVSPGPPMKTGFQRHDDLFRRDRTGRHGLARQPSTTSGSICPIEWRAETAAGGGAR